MSAEADLSCLSPPTKKRPKFGENQDESAKFGAGDDFEEFFFTSPTSSGFVPEPSTLTSNMASTHLNSSSSNLSSSNLTSTSTMTLNLSSSSLTSNIASAHLNSSSSNLSPSNLTSNMTSTQINSSNLSSSNIVATANMNTSTNLVASNHNLEVSNSGMDSGFSDGATPPASCEDSQESFAVNLENGDHQTTFFPTNFNGSNSIHQGSSEVQNRKSLEMRTSESSIENSNVTNDEDDDEEEEDNEEEDDDEDDDDNMSEISGMSDMSGANWKPTAGPFAWVQEKMLAGVDPRVLLKDMISSDSEIPEGLDQLTLWKIILNMLSEPPKRKKLDNVNTLEDVVNLIRKSSKITILTGAGVSVSCGIPDFRSRDGVYARLAVDFPDLPDPQAMFDIQYFRKDPRPFFKFAREIYPGQFKPSPCHRFIRNIEKRGKLLRNYTQNIDTLEQVVGIERIIQCHGSFASATCMKCGHKVNSDSIKEDIFQQRIPYCPVCPRDPSFSSDKCLKALESNFPAKSPSKDSGSNNSPSTDQKPSGNPETQQSSQPAEIPPSSSLATSTPSTSKIPHSNSSTPGTSSNHLPVEVHEAIMQMSKEEEENVLVPGIMKPDIVFFGEGLSDEFHNTVGADKEQTDLLIMVGSSLKVRPVALIPSSIPAHVPQILINREPLPHLRPDVELLGDCDGIINQICKLLGEGWEDAIHKEGMKQCEELNERTEEREKCDKEQPQQLQSPPIATPKAVEEAKDSEQQQQQQDDENSNASTTTRDVPWLPKPRENLASRLPENSFYFQPPSRYIFPGAEIFANDSEDEDSSSMDSSSSSDENETQQNEMSTDDISSIKDNSSIKDISSNSIEKNGLNQDSSLINDISSTSTEKNQDSSLINDISSTSIEKNQDSSSHNFNPNIQNIDSDIDDLDP